MVCRACDRATIVRNVGWMASGIKKRSQESGGDERNERINAERSKRELAGTLYFVSLRFASLRFMSPKVFSSKPRACQTPRLCHHPLPAGDIHQGHHHQPLHSPLLPSLVRFVIFAKTQNYCFTAWLLAQTGLIRQACSQPANQPASHSISPRYFR